MDSQIQYQVFRGMENPVTYPHKVQGLRQAQTHISRVFLTGKYVYKIKKAVDFGFLNFSTLERRQEFCRREIELNRRLADDIYLGVIPITGGGGVFSIGGSGVPVEYAVQMRQLSESNALDHMMNIGEISRLDMVALGRKLSDFYEKTPVSTLVGPDRIWDTVFGNCMENFIQTEESCCTVLNQDIWETIRGAVTSFLKLNRPLFEKRAQEGRVRDCHGDLRCEHIYFTDSGIQIIDCIEFNDFLRHIDVISDLAFLLMDLDSKQETGLGDTLLNRYLEQTRDFESMRLIAFYKCYRAMVRCKVNCLALAQAGLKTDQGRHFALEACTYLDLAFQYALQFFRPRIWVVCGMAASGKSTLAKALEKVTGCEVLRSDVIRKRLFGLQPDESGTELFGEKIYSSLAGSLTYGKMLCLAQEKLIRGNSVILDATFSRKTHRDDLLLLAEEKGIKPVFIECHASDEILKDRLLAREFFPSVSDARIDHFKRLKARYERFRYAGNALYIRVDTAASINTLIQQILIQAFRLDTDRMIDISVSQSGTEPATA